MKKKRDFSFRWKLIENYAAAIVALIFLWFFINGIVNHDNNSLLVSFVMIAIAPLLITFVDKKSSGF